MYEYNRVEKGVILLDDAHCHTVSEDSEFVGVSHGMFNVSKSSEIIHMTTKYDVRIVVGRKS